MLREYLFVPGMGETTARRFRDKLAMRRRARSGGLPCPPFVHTLNDADITAWTNEVPPPWVLKPRSSAAALGIRRLASADDLWGALETLGDGRADYLVEQFIPGDVFHVDSIVFGLEVRFACVSRYETPPLVVAHDAGIFVTRTLPAGDPNAAALEQLERARSPVVRAAPRRLAHGVHPRARWLPCIFSKPRRASAAPTSSMWSRPRPASTCGASGRAWKSPAKMATYEPPPRSDRSSGIVLSLARQEEPDLSAYTDPEILVRIRKPHHAGLIVASPDGERIVELLRRYTERFYTDFHAWAPPPERPTD